MKKFLFLLFLIGIINISILGATLNGIVKIEPVVFASKDPVVGAENFGVFVFIEQTGEYDITDAEGKFTLKKLEIGKEYTIVCQKKGMKDYKENIKITKEDNNIVINIKPIFTKIIKTGESESIINTVTKYVPSKKFSVKGLVKSKNLNDNIYINLKNKGYGIVVKPNEEFEIKLEKGEYIADIEQEGMYSESIAFKVESDTVLKSIEMVNNKFGEIRLNFDKKQVESTLYLYKDEQLRLKQVIDKNIEKLRIPDLRQGNYKILVKSKWYKDFSQTLFLKENVEINVKREEGNFVFEQDKIFFNIYPENLYVSLKIYDKNGKKIIEKDGVIENSVENLNKDNEPYKAVFSSFGYKEQVYNDLRSGQVVNVFMEKEENFIFVSGAVYPFKENVNIEVIGEKNSKTTTDKNGEFILKLDLKKSDKKIVKISSEGYEDKYITLDFNENKNIQRLNIELERINTSLKGVVVSNNKGLEGVIVLLDGINMWCKTNETGEYSFPVVPEGKYKIIFKKIGYKEVKNDIEILKDKTTILNTELIPYANIILKSNISDFNIEIENIDTLKRDKVFFKANGSIFNQQLILGKKKITLSKDGYKTLYYNIELKYPGEEKEIKVLFDDLMTDKIENINRLEEISIYIDNMEIDKASKVLDEVKRRLKNSDIGSKESKKMAELEKKIEKYRKKIYDTDNFIRNKIKEIRENLNELENSDIGYVKKRELLDEKYKEIIDYTEKLLNDYFYTTLKSEIYYLQGDIYTKMGMTNSAQKSYETAKKYK